MQCLLLFSKILGPGQFEHAVHVRVLCKHEASMDALAYIGVLNACILQMSWPVPEKFAWKPRLLEVLRTYVVLFSQGVGQSEEKRFPVSNIQILTYLDPKSM